MFDVKNKRKIRLRFKDNRCKSCDHSQPPGIHLMWSSREEGREEREERGNGGRGEGKEIDRGREEREKMR